MVKLLCCFLVRVVFGNNEFLLSSLFLMLCFVCFLGDWGGFFGGVFLVFFVVIENSVWGLFILILGVLVFMNCMVNVFMDLRIGFIL